MSEKVYTEKILAMLIEVANQYVEEPEVRTGIVAKCHQEIGLLITGAPGKNTIDMDNRESMALKTALRRRQNENRNQTLGASATSKARSSVVANN